MKKLRLIFIVSFLFFFSILQSFTIGYCGIQQKINLDNQPISIIFPIDFIIYNPYDKVDFNLTKHYKANLHTHTTISDGSSDPKDIIYHYNNIGSYEILAITDHNGNTWSWNNWITENPSEHSLSSEYYPELNMLAISGNEMSAGHHRSSLLNDFSHSGLFLRLSFWFIEKNNGLSIFNHPGRYDYADSWYQNYFDFYDDMLCGIEVFNQGDRYPTDRILWDLINKERDPNDLIWGFSNDDMHHISSHSFRNYQHFLMKNLTENEFRNSILNGAFYFSYEPNGSNSENPSYGIAMTPKLNNVIINENRIEIICDNFNSILWYDENTQIVSEDSIFNVSIIDSNFVRAVLINEYGSTYTQPFGIEKI